MTGFIDAEQWSFPVQTFNPGNIFKLLSSLFLKFKTCLRGSCDLTGSFFIKSATSNVMDFLKIFGQTSHDLTD